MPRAALLIGVSQSGDLPKLQAVEDGIAAMTAWAHSQSDIEQVVAITDADEPVTIMRLTKAIMEIVENGPLDQLVVYFAGHGMSKSTEEYWLLSEAPKMSGEAVDLRASSEFARRAGIPHVVFISDACRTAPEGIEAQGVTGTPIFTNSHVFGRTWVDRFFATAVGDPALEIKDKDVSAEQYSSLYTSVLVRALMGDPSSLLTPVEGKREGELVSWALSENLPHLVRDELDRRKLGLKLAQAPMARVESGSVGVLSRVKVKRSVSLHADVPTATSLDPVDATNRAMHELLAAGGATNATADRIAVQLAETRAANGDTMTATEDRMVATTNALSSGFGAAHHETGSGLKVRGGNSIDAVLVPGGKANWWADGAATQIPSPVNSLVRFTSGHLAVIPLFTQWLAGLTFNDDGTNLVAVDYEPMDYHPRWDEIGGRIDAHRSLRSLVTAASREGALHPDAALQDDLDEWLDSVDGLDPTLAIYRSYAQPVDDVVANPARREADRELRLFPKGMNAALFDLVMLADRHSTMHGGQANALASMTLVRVFPAFPMLTQGWPLQRVYGPPLPLSLERLGEHVVSSHWTLFAPAAEPMLHDAFTHGEL